MSSRGLAKRLPREKEHTEKTARGKKKNFLETTPTKMEDVFRRYHPITYKSMRADVYENMTLSSKTEYEKIEQTVKANLSCAVVGTSSTLLKKKYGKEIDASDIVFRINNIKLLNTYAEYTGQREDIRIATYPFKMQNVTLIYYCHVPWFPSVCWTRSTLDRKLRISPFFVFHVKRSHGLLKWPTTGLVAYEVANALCSTVKTYGFGISAISNCSHFYNVDLKTWKCGHMYGGAKMRNSPSMYKNYVSSSHHDFKKEQTFFKHNPYVSNR